MTKETVPPGPEECIERLMAVVEDLAAEGAAPEVIMPSLTDVIVMVALKNPDPDNPVRPLETTFATLATVIDRLRILPRRSEHARRE